MLYIVVCENSNISFIFSVFTYLIQVYNSNISTDVKEPVKEPEFEYVNISTKTEYKEAIPLKNIDLKSSKKLEEKVKVLKEKWDPKPIKEKDEEEIKVKPTVRKADPKPIKEKDEVELINNTSGVR